MSKNFSRMRAKGAPDPIGPVIAGIALLTLPLLRLISSAGEPVEAGYWVSLLLGSLMVIYGGTLPHRAESIARRAGGDDAA